MRKVIKVPKLLLCLALSGCGSELNDNTLGMTRTVVDLEVQQIYENLAAFIDNPYWIPSQVILTGGGSQITYSITPTFAKITQPWLNLSISASDSWTENWGMSPITDPEDVRRLRALYRLAVWGDYKKRAGTDRDPVDINFAAEYPRPLLTDQTSTSGGTITFSQADCNDPSMGRRRVVAVAAAAAAAANGSSAVAVQHTVQASLDGKTPDEIAQETLSAESKKTAQALAGSRAAHAAAQAALRGAKLASAAGTPGCSTYPYYYPTTSLPGSIATIDTDVPHEWMYWSRTLIGPPVFPSPISEKYCKYLGNIYPQNYTLHQIYTCSPPVASDGNEEEQRRKAVARAEDAFGKFVLFVMAATPNTGGGGGGGGGSAGASGGGGGGGGNKSKGSAGPILLPLK